MSQAIFPTISGQTTWASAAIGGDILPACSLYLHVPFCFHKCHYCDFYSFVDSQDRQGVFLEALESELRALALGAARASGSENPGRPELRTIFVGGGTPSLLRVELWERLLRTLDGAFDLSAIRAGRGEFTVECNPETVSAELMGTLRAGGVDRVSVGAQSFDPRHLETLERWHDPENVGRALELAASAGIERRSVDLIYAIPGQSLEDWESDLDRALALDPGVEHVSAYNLTYEPNTAMAVRLKQGDFAPAPEELEVDMHLMAVERLGRAGMARYEVSNFARATARGAESLHNLAYWRCESWLAAGPSASGHTLVRAGGGHRWKNVPRLSDWLEGLARSGGWSPIVDHEPPDALRLIAEQLMMGLRLSEGVNGAGIVKNLERAAGAGSAQWLERAAAAQADFGLLLTEPDGRWRLSDRGFLQADGVAAALMSAVRRSRG